MFRCLHDVDIAQGWRDEPESIRGELEQWGRVGSRRCLTVMRGVEREVRARMSTWVRA